MKPYRTHLPQLDGGLYLTDAGLETDLIFNKGVNIQEFAAHTLLDSELGRRAMKDYFDPFLQFAKQHRTGFILDCPTWKAHRHWADSLSVTPESLQQTTNRAVAFMDEIRQPHIDTTYPIVLNGLIGPKGDAYHPESLISTDEAVDYHAEQLGWLALTAVDMVTAMTLTQSAEAVGMVKAAKAVDIPIVISFTVETDGSLPTGQPLSEAVRFVDWATESGPAYYMVNCAHPDHFDHVLKPGDWLQRIRGIRCNASRCSHAELDACETLDDGDPVELALQYQSLVKRMPWINVVGGCCGSDFRHVSAIADKLLQPVKTCRND